MFKKPGRDEYLYYNTRGYWVVGYDTGEPEGWWMVESAARTPGAITATWYSKEHDDGGVAVPSAKIITIPPPNAGKRKAARLADGTEWAWDRDEAEVTVRAGGGKKVKFTCTKSPE